MKRAMLSALTLAFALASSDAAFGQSMVNNQGPFISGGHSFFERIGFGFSLRGPNFFFNQGNGFAPQFGGYQPGAGISGGASVPLGGGVRLNWFGEASQGARSSLTSQTPTLTTINGYGGYVADVTQSPFVIGVVPVVGEHPYYGPANTVEGRLLRGEMWYDDEGQLHFGPRVAAPPAVGPAVAAAGVDPVAAAAPVDDPHAAPARAPRRDPDLRIGAKPAAEEPAPVAAAAPAVAAPSSAEAGAESLAEIARRKGTEEGATDAEGQDQLARGKQAEAAGKFGAAKAYYRMGLKKASGALRDELQSRLDALSAK